MFEIVEDDLSGAATRNLLAIHLNGMSASSPPGSIFALDLSGLRAPDVTLWSLRDGDLVIGIGAPRLQKYFRPRIRYRLAHASNKTGLAGPLKTI